MENPSKSSSEPNPSSRSWAASLPWGKPKKQPPVLPISSSSTLQQTPEKDGFASVPTHTIPQDVVLDSNPPNDTSFTLPQKDTKSEGQESSAVDGEVANVDNNQPKPSLAKRAKAGTRRFGRHTKNALFHSWFNLLLIFVPIGIAAKAAGLSATIVFSMNAVAIVPLAGLLSFATESVASRLGDTLGALLNVSFGNAVELIIL
jgi:Ca2+:H+ antiporter